MHSLNRGFLLYATLAFKLYHNHIYLYRNHPSPSTATRTPNKHIERTLLSSDYILMRMKFLKFDSVLPGFQTRARDGF